MGTKERRARERLETRDLILGAARDMFAADGYEAVTMRAIAERIEYSPTAIYHHFPSKQALLTELCQADFAGLARHFTSNVAATDPVERLKSIGEAYLRFAIEYPSQYRFMFMTVIPDVELSEDFVTENMANPERNAYLFLRSACADAIEQGRFRSEITDPDMVAQVLWGGIHGLVSLHIAKSHQKFVTWKDLQESAGLAIDAMLRGLLRQVGV